MGFKTRLTNGLRKLGLSENQQRAPFEKRVPSINLNQLKLSMNDLHEMAPGLSQPVWGPEISTVGAYSREGYTSKTFDTPAVPFRVQKTALQQDEDTQLAINHLSSQVTGGAHYVKAEQSFVADYFERLTKDMHFDTLDTIIAKELLWYGNSVFKPRMGIRNVRNYKDLMHIPISSFVRIWWDRQRIPYKYEFRGAEYQGYHNPKEIIHFKWNPVDASAFGTGFAVSMTSPRLFQFPIGGGEYDTRELPSLLDRKYATQYTMQHAEQRYVSRNLYTVENGDEQSRLNLQAQVEGLDIGQDIVAGVKVEAQELGSQARNFNPEQFTDLTIGPIFKALNDFRGKQGSSESHQFANARSSAALDEIGLSAFPISLKEQFLEQFFKPWYEANPLPNPVTGGMTYLSWNELKLQIEFGKVEKKDIPIQDQIKLLELYINSPLPKDPVVLTKLFEQAGLGITKDMDTQLAQMFDPANQIAMQGLGLTPTGQPDPNAQYYDNNMNLPQHDMGGGDIPNNWDNQNVGSPPMDEAIFDSMIKDVRGNSYKRNPQNQDYGTGRNYE
jgi:hypothetical protein